MCRFQHNMRLYALADYILLAVDQEFVSELCVSQSIVCQSANCQSVNCLSVSQ